MINLCDSDLIAYRAAASCEPTKAKPFLEPLQAALFRVHDMIQTIIKGTNCNELECYLGGSDNFRKKLYPAYKGNRTKPPPTYLQECRELLVVEYGAKIVNGRETDDELGIRQTFHDGNSRIVSLDKDLLQISGWHFNWVRDMHTLVSPLDGLRTFYKQVILGDGTDNIPGFDTKLRNSLPKFIEKLQSPLDSMSEPNEMYDYCLSVYLDANNTEEILQRNCRLLYILTEEGGQWNKPT